MSDASSGRAVLPVHELSYRQLLSATEVRALLLATLLSRLAGRMFARPIVLYALTQMDSPVLAGWLAFAAMAPGLAISPIAGALIDRVGSVWAITVDMAASAACVAALIVADRLGWASAPVLLGLTGLFSLTSPLSAAGIRALLPRLVPVDRTGPRERAGHGDPWGDRHRRSGIGRRDRGLRRTDTGAGHDRRHLCGSRTVRRQHSSAARPVAARGSAAVAGVERAAACRATAHAARTGGGLFAL